MKTYLVDLAERVGATFAETFLAVLIATSGLNVSVLRVAFSAGIAAAAAVLKGSLARFTGDKDSASLVPSVKV